MYDFINSAVTYMMVIDYAATNLIRWKKSYVDENRFILGLTLSILPQKNIFYLIIQSILKLRRPNALICSSKNKLPVFVVHNVLVHVVDMQRKLEIVLVLLSMEVMHQSLFSVSVVSLLPLPSESGLSKICKF